MGTFTNSLFQVFLGWIRILTAEIWNTLFSTPGRATLLSWLGDHWKVLALLMCAAGLCVDLIVYLFRWQPYRVWREQHRKNRQQEDEAENDEEISAAADAEETPAPGRYPNASDRTDRWTESAPEKRYFQKINGDQRENAGADFREETVIIRKDPERTEPDPEEIPIRERKNFRPATRRNAERYIRNAYEAESEAEQLAAWQRPEENEPLPSEAARTTEKFEQAIRPRRRRNVKAMLTDRADDQVPAPEQLIDRNEAYRRPVYPRSWLEDE